MITITLSNKLYWKMKIICRKNVTFKKKLGDFNFNLELTARILPISSGLVNPEKINRCERYLSVHKYCFGLWPDERNRIFLSILTDWKNLPQIWNLLQLKNKFYLANVSQKSFLLQNCIEILIGLRSLKPSALHS